MPTGVIKWFKSEKGYGFITAHDPTPTPEIFVHFSSLQNDGFKTINAGTPVSFDLNKNDKGYFATNVVAIKK